jgi:hypothetical protein
VLNGEFIFLMQSISFAFIAILPIITFNISNNYFPDRIIEGMQKKKFNRIFLINFLLISFLFGFVFQDFKDYRNSVKISHIFSVAGKLQTLSILFTQPYYFLCHVDLSLSVFYMAITGCAGI